MQAGRPFLFTMLFSVIMAGFFGCSSEKLPNLQASRADNSRSIVFGSLFNQDQGQFVEGATVQANPGFSQVQSDEDGNFLFDSLGRGQFLLTARAGTYTASVEINTLVTDVVSVNLTFGTTARGAEDFSFLDGSTQYLGKKLLDQSAPQLYENLLLNVPTTFLELGTMDWNPFVPEEILFSAREPQSPFKIYKYRIDTQVLETLVEDTVLDATEPSYSPDGKRFAFLQNNEILIAFVDSADTTRQKLIRDQKLVLKDTEGRIVLNADRRNEQGTGSTAIPVIPGFTESGGALGLRDPATGTPIPFIDPVTGLPVNDPLTGLPARTPAVFAEAAFYRTQLNEYFNYVCVQSLPSFPCINQFLHIFDQGTFDDNIMFNATNPSLVLNNPGFSSNGYGFSLRPTDYSNTLFFDSMNSPAECEMVFSSPRWSPNGNQVAFLARPSGCTTAQRTVCKRTCDDSSLELFIAPVDVDRDNILGRGLAFSQADYERMDKLTVMQITNDAFEDLNPTWDAGSGAILYEKAKTTAATGKRFYLYSSNPTPGGYQTRLLLRHGAVEYQAQVSPDGKRILWVSKEISEKNPFGFSQVILGNWSGVVSSDQQVTFYPAQTEISNLRFYKLLPSAFRSEILN